LATISSIQKEALSGLYLRPARLALRHEHRMQNAENRR
jgi:hypothetical protein